MMQEKEIKEGEVIWLYIKGNNGIIISGCRSQASHIEIPESLEGLTVTEIGKKAFLGNKNLTEVWLPDSVREIGNWAFAHCSNLKMIAMPGRDIRMGKGVFKDCRALTYAKVQTGSAKTGQKTEVGMRQAAEDACQTGSACSAAGTDRAGRMEPHTQISRLLAATPIMLDAEYLFLPGEAGSREWLEKWDSRLLALLRKDDESGFTKLVLCGEEDLLANLPDFVAEKRRSKAELCFLRLLNPMGLAKDNEEELRSYLQTHAKGCESEAAWETVLRFHGEERPYYELLMDTGCVTADNLSAMLFDMQESHAEMKALLIRYKEKLTESDFFDSLSLD